MNIPIRIYCHGHLIHATIESTDETQDTPQSIDVHITAGGRIRRRDLLEVTQAVKQSLTAALRRRTQAKLLNAKPK